MTAWRRIGRAIPLAAVLCLAALPLVVLLVTGPAEAGHYVEAIAVADIDLSALAGSLVFAVGGAAGSALVGGVLGAVVATTAVPARRVAIFGTVAMLAAPPAFWWIGATYSGGAIVGSGIVSGSVVAGLSLAPITFLLVLAAAAETPGNAYDAGRLMLPPFRRWRHVLAPILVRALLAGFLLVMILLLGESEIPFLFGFRTAMTDVVTRFSQTFDVRRTVPMVVPLLAVVVLLAALLAKPLFAVLWSSTSGQRGIPIVRPSTISAIASWLLPSAMLLSIAGYVGALLADPINGTGRVTRDLASGFISVGEPVGCALIAVTVAALTVYPVRREGAARVLSILALVLFCVPAALTAIGWLAVGQMVGRGFFNPMVAHVSRMLGLAVVALVTGCTRIPRSLEEAADLIDMRPITRAWRVVAPLVAPSAVAAAGLTAALVFADRDVPSILMSPGDSRFMLNFYLVSANAPSALIGGSALLVFAAGSAAILLSAGVTAMLFARRRG